MSNADDRPCPDCGETADPHLCDGRRQVVRRHTELVPQPAPSGDAAKVRDAGVTLEDNRAVARLAEAYPDVNALPGPVLDGIAQALANHRREAYAAGKADERWAFLEGLTCDESETGCSHTICSDVLAIARRGSEGK